jgi:hypothetical protein
VVIETRISDGGETSTVRVAFWAFFSGVFCISNSSLISGGIFAWQWQCDMAATAIRYGHLKDGKLSAGDAGGLNFFRSIVTFSRGWRPEFALRWPLEFPTGCFGGGFPCRARIPTSRVSS